MLKQLLPTGKSQRGQSFMELAISLVFLLVLLMVVIDLGWAFYTMTALRDTAQEAASYGIMCPNEDRILQRLRMSTSAPLSMEDYDNGNMLSTITFIDPSDPSNPIAQGQHGDLVRVHVEYNHQIIVPFVASFIGTSTYPLKVDVSDTIMVDLDECP
jgi:Flp pilus assembly protein TadG